MWMYHWISLPFVPLKHLVSDMLPFWMDNSSDLKVFFSNPKQVIWWILEPCCIKINILFVRYKTAVTDIQQASQMNWEHAQSLADKLCMQHCYCRVVIIKMQEKRTEEKELKGTEALCKVLSCGIGSYQNCHLISKSDLQNPSTGKTDSSIYHIPTPAKNFLT